MLNMSIKQEKTRVEDCTYRVEFFRWSTYNSNVGSYDYYGSYDYELYGLAML